jgi:hypothetical protein
MSDDGRSIERCDIDELLVRAWKYDDKPHQLYSHIRSLAIKYQDPARPSYRDEIIRLMDLEYERPRSSAIREIMKPDWLERTYNVLSWVLLVLCFLYVIMSIIVLF